MQNLAECAIFCNFAAVMSKKNESVRALKFLLFSASAGVIQMGSFALMEEALHWPHWLCYLIALVLSVLWNFTLNRRFTFRSYANVPRAMALVALYYAFFTPSTTWLEHALTAEPVAWNPYLVTAINMLLNLITEFLWQRFVVYRGKLDER